MREEVTQATDTEPAHSGEAVAATDSPAPTLAGLVARTAGPQPWRKLFHAFNATVIASTLILWNPSRTVAVVTLVAITGMLLAVDLARLAYPTLNELFFRTLIRLASPREERGIASSTWYAMGILAAVALFPRAEAISAIFVMGLADPAAGYVGRRFGKRPFMGGTLEGSAVFFAASLAVLILRHPWPAALAAALVSTLAERRSWPLDDNLAVPLVCAGMLAGLGLLL